MIKMFCFTKNVDTMTDFVWWDSFYSVSGNSIITASYMQFVNMLTTDKASTQHSKLENSIEVHEST